MRFGEFRFFYGPAIDLITGGACIPVQCLSQVDYEPGIFSAILGRGPGAFLTGKISDIHPELGKFSKHSKLMIFSNLT